MAMQSFTITVDIAVSRDRVIELFDDPDNLCRWQPGFESFEHLSGEPGRPGARSKLVYRHGNRRIEMIETVTDRNLPDELHGAYQWDGGENTLHNRFVELGPVRTRWESTCSYRFSGLLARLVGRLFANRFERQTRQWMQNFKALCEAGRDVREPT